jgi:hypothetical protein
MPGISIVCFAVLIVKKKNFRAGFSQIVSAGFHRLIAHLEIKRNVENGDFARLRINRVCRTENS